MILLRLGSAPAQNESLEDMDRILSDNKIVIHSYESIFFKQDYMFHKSSINSTHHLYNIDEKRYIGKLFDTYISYEKEFKIKPSIYIERLIDYGFTPDFVMCSINSHPNDCIRKQTLDFEQCIQRFKQVKIVVEISLFYLPCEIRNIAYGYITWYKKIELDDISKLLLLRLERAENRVGNLKRRVNNLELELKVCREENQKDNSDNNNSVGI